MLKQIGALLPGAETQIEGRRSEEAAMPNKDLSDAIKASKTPASNAAAASAKEGWSNLEEIIKLAVDEANQTFENDAPEYSFLYETVTPDRRDVGAGLLTLNHTSNSTLVFCPIKVTAEGRVKLDAQICRLGATQRTKHHTFITLDADEKAVGDLLIEFFQRVQG